MPCFKLEIRFGRADMVKRFLHSGRSGFYVSVLREGSVARDDAIERVPGSTGITVRDIVSLYSTDADNQPLLRRVSELAALPQGWRDYFRKRLWQPDA
jgi:MOSC domain-containing protein YiiM